MFFINNYIEFIVGFKERFTVGDIFCYYTILAFPVLMK